MIYISVFLELVKNKDKYSQRRLMPSGLIVVTGDDGDAVQFNYSKRRIFDLCHTYYQNPEVMIIIDPYIAGIERIFEKWAHQELGFVLGVAYACGIKNRVLYKKTYYKYFGISQKVERAAYSYCLAHYPKLSFMYKIKDPDTIDKACAAYLMAKFQELKIEARERWHRDMNYILEELDDGNEEVLG